MKRTHKSVERISHDLSARDDPALIAFPREKGVTAEACPTCNAPTGMIDGIEGRSNISLNHRHALGTIDHPRDLTNSLSDRIPIIKPMMIEA
jgi:hypothetical protein